MLSANFNEGQNMSRQIDYGNLMHRALRTLIQEVLQGVADNGLPGAHHFFITFDTRHPDAKLADWLRERYPEEMTVVMQHWYEDLHVDDDGFGVTLNFGDTPEALYIPFDSIRAFVDPSVEFGLRFETQDHDDDEDDDYEDEIELDEVEEEPRQDAEVVQLDTWRK